MVKEVRNVSFGGIVGIRALQVIQPAREEALAQGGAMSGGTSQEQASAGGARSFMPLRVSSRSRFVRGLSPTRSAFQTSDTTQRLVNRYA